MRRVLAATVCITACSLELAPLGPAKPEGSIGGSAGAAASGGTAGASAGGGGAGGAGGVPKEGPPRGNYALGFYAMVVETDFQITSTVSLYDTSCKPLATVGTEFSKALALAGTGRLGDGRVLSHAGPCGCPSTPCYLVADPKHPWGYGVKNIPLSPFRSIAVNTADVPIGTPLYIPAFDGLEMPGDPPWGGFVHDGCVRADDTRSELEPKQLDWFVALQGHQAELDAELNLVSVIVHEGGTRCP